MGLIIGKAGATIKAIRKVLTIRAIADQVRVTIRLVEDGQSPSSNNPLRGFRFITIGCCLGNLDMLVTKLI